MKIGPKGLAVCKAFELFVPYVYDDKRAPVKGKYVEWKKGMPVKGTLTCGYGHTDAAKYKLSFKLSEVPAGFRLTEAKALEILDVDLDECEEAANRLIKVPLTQGQFDCMVDVIFNMGAGNAKPIIARINARKMKEARDCLDLYVYSKGEYMRGLQRRRDAEQALWDLGDYEVKKVKDPVTETIPGIALPKKNEIVEHSADVDPVPKEKPAVNVTESLATGTIVVAGGAGMTAGYPWYYIAPLIIIALFVGFLVLNYFRRHPWTGKSIGRQSPASSLTSPSVSSEKTDSTSEKTPPATFSLLSAPSSVGSSRSPSRKSKRASTTRLSSKRTSTQRVRSTSGAKASPKIKRQSR